MKRFWQATSLGMKDLIDQVAVDGLTGHPTTFNKIINGWVEKYDLDTLYPENDHALWFNTIREGKKFMGIKIGTTFKRAWSRIGGQPLEKKTYQGIYLYTVVGEYYPWSHQREWLHEFISGFRGKCAEAGLKAEDMEIHVMVQNPNSIQDLYGLATAINIHPLDGILYGNKFLLPMNGYIDLDMEEATDAMREAVLMAAEVMGVTQGDGEKYDDYLHRLQIHVFNYEIRKTEHLAEGKPIDEFTYGDKTVDVDKVYALAAIRGTVGESSMVELAKEAEDAIKVAVDSGNVDNIVHSMSRLYAILLARVEFGNEVDHYNQKLTPIVSQDIDRALKHGVKLVEVIDNVRKRRFDEKLGYVKLQLEKEKVELAKSQYEVPEEDDTGITEIISNIEDKEIDSFISSK